jgi:hypothetical protein
MKAIELIVRNKRILLGTAAAILLAAIDIAFTTLLATDAHAAPLAAEAAPTVGVKGAEPASLRVLSSSSRSEAGVGLHAEPDGNL